jgi:hypothetical protein
MMPAGLPPEIILDKTVPNVPLSSCFALSRPFPLVRAERGGNRM